MDIRVDFPLLEFAERKPIFRSEIQRKEYEQALIDVHKSQNRKDLIHSKKGMAIVLLYMNVWQMGPVQAMRELITDEAYTMFVAP